MKKLFTIFLAIIVTIPLVCFAATSTTEDIVLPPPAQTTMILEESIWRRASIRNFTDEPVSLQDLSTILWAAYGLRDDGTRTVPLLLETYAAHLYVLLPDAIYTYDVLNHTLRFYKEGDYRYIGQYDAPVLIGIVWDATLLSDGDVATAQIGMIGQNIQLMCNALDLGSVICGDFPPTYTLSRIGLPEHEIPRIIIPLGHLVFPYNFAYFPFQISLLPRIQQSTFTLSDALEARTEADVIGHEITRSEQTQLLWSSYGYSYLLDRADYGMDFHISRHRTVPSAKGYYPFHIYAVSSSRVFEYIPNIYNPLQFSYFLPRFPFPVFTYFKPLFRGDVREEIATASTNPEYSTAPLLIVIALNVEKTNKTVDFSGEEWRWIWYYEAGSIAHNILLSSAAWDLSTSLGLAVDADLIRSTLDLDDTFIPILIVPAGKAR
ncbi:MAG: nitroreductase family protein [Thermoplasmatota archaeon]